MDGGLGHRDYLTPHTSYPQKVGKRLQDYNPNIYEWFPVDYIPYLTLTDSRTLIERSDYALSLVTPDVLSRPAGTKFVLSGLSQGTLSVGRLYNEFRYGNLQSRKDDLIGVINFGDGLRPAGWSVPMPGSVPCPGNGIIGTNVPLQHSFGSIPGLINDPDPWYLSFNQPGDAAGCINLTGLSRDAMDFLVERFLYGIPIAGVGNRTIGTDPGEDFAGLISALFNDLFEEAGFHSLSFSERFQIVTAIGGAVLSWLNIGTGAALGALNDIVDGAGTFLANAIDPHQQYDRNPAGVPWPYLGIPGNTKTATQLAYEWAVETLTPQVEPEPTIIYTGGLATTGGGKNKPIFYYAQGTSWLWNWFGFKAGSQGGGGTVEIADGVFVPDVYVLGNVPIFGQPYIPATHIKALDGQYVFWEGGIVNDPFPYLLDSDLWHWKRVPYPASAAFMGPSIEAGVNWVVNDILSQPAGTSFALGGYSQGAAVMSRVYNEFRQGRLAARREGLRAVVTFGNPMREQGHTYPGGQYSGACDIPGDTSAGHGMFPQISDVDDVFSWYVNRFARLQNTEEMVWDFTMPNELISGVGDSPDGQVMQRFATNGLRLIPLAALFDIERVMGELWTQYGKAPAGVPQGTDPDGIGYQQVKVVNPVTGEVGYQPGGGHIMYPFFPPPNADGSIPESGLTCYQLAAQYLNTVGQRINDELHPVLVAVPAASAVRSSSFSWFTSLPEGV